jgi:hypothetical protein
MKQTEISLLKEGDRVMLKSGNVAVFASDLSARLKYFEPRKVAYIDVTELCPDLDHCTLADNSDGRFHPCYGHKLIVWPAQIVKKL